MLSWSCPLLALGYLVLASLDGAARKVVLTLIGELLPTPTPTFGRDGPTPHQGREGGANPDGMGLGELAPALT